MFNIILNIVHDSGIYVNIVHITERGMFKTLFSLARGAAAAAEEEINDRHALLDRQIRDAAAAVERGKRAPAVAIAHDEDEGRRLEATITCVTDLEEVPSPRLLRGRKDLGAEATERLLMEINGAK